MSGELLALALAIGVPVLIRLLDWFLPDGRHFTFVNRYSHPNHDDEPDEPVE